MFICSQDKLSLVELKEATVDISHSPCIVRINGQVYGKYSQIHAEKIIDDIVYYLRNGEDVYHMPENR